MGYKFYDKDEKRLQRKLIPLNIFVAILSLVAAISLIVTPLITIDLGQAMSAMTEVMGDAMGGSSDGSGDEGNGGGQTTDAIISAIDGIDAKIVISPLGMAKIAFAEESQKGELLLESLFFETGLFQNLMVSMTNIMIVAMAELGNETGINYGELRDTLVKLDDAKSEEQFNSTVNEYIGKIESQTNTTLDAEAKDGISEMCGEMYKRTVEALDNDASKFSLEAMVCVLMSKGVDEESDRVAVTNYGDLVKSMMDGTASMPGEGDSSSSVTDLMTTLNESAGYFGYGFYGILLFAGVWAILFLFSFLHLFSKNKRFTMWYVKIFGCWPCILFGVLPLVGKAVIASVAGEMGPTIAAIFGCISSMTWISGACYLLLWAVSIFWAFPIKRKIRRLRG